jgi:hypothetical protein
MPAIVEDIRSQYEDRICKVGGGGYVLGIDIADDGVMMIHSDTCVSVYLRDPNNPARISFEALLKKSKCVANPADADYPVANDGCWGVSLCSTNSNFGYFGAYDSVWKTTDRGVTVSRCPGFASSNGHANYSPPKFIENRIACDPIQPNVVYAGTVPTFVLDGSPRTGGATGASGGSGYTVGDIVTVAGGTGAGAILQIGAVGAGGAVTSLNMRYPESGSAGAWKVPPALPASCTGGTGTGLTVMLTLEGGNGMLRRSIDGGTTFTEMAAIPFSQLQTRGVCHTVFDRSSSPITVGGQTRTSRVAICSPGNGIYLSTDGGQNWTSIGGPLYCKVIRFAIDGVLYANNDTFGSLNGSFATGGAYLGLWKYAGGTWTDISPGGIKQALTFACDPNNAARIIAFQENAMMSQTLDRGATPWSTQTFDLNVVIGPDGASWLLSVHRGISIGAAKFDPSKTDTVYITTGLTVYRCAVPTPIPNVLDMIQEYNGELENLVSVDVKHFGEGHPVMLACMDKDIFTKFPHEMDEYPTTNIMGPYGRDDLNDPYGVNVVSLVMATNVGGSALEPRNVFACLGYYSTHDHFSHNGGRLWEWPVTPCAADAGSGAGQAAGSVAINHHDPMNIVRCVTAAHGLPKYTKNGGVTWANCAFSPVITAPGTGFHHAYYVQKQMTVADPSNAGHFYIVYNGDVNYGLYKSTDGGANFALHYPGNITSSSNEYWNGRLRMVPGHPGHMWACASTFDVPLRRSTNYGVTWTDVPFVRFVNDINFGKAATGAPYPAIYIYGRVAATGSGAAGDPAYLAGKGLYRSIDEGVSWQKMASGDSAEIMSGPLGMDGDKGIFGRLYYAVAGAIGWRYMKLKTEPAPTTRVRLS